MRTPTGSVRKKNGRWRARITWTEDGKRRERVENVTSKNVGLDRVNAWRRQWQETGTVPPPGKKSSP